MLSILLLSLNAFAADSADLATTAAGVLERVAYRIDLPDASVWTSNAPLCSPMFASTMVGLTKSTKGNREKTLYASIVAINSRGGFSHYLLQDTGADGILDGVQASSPAEAKLEESAYSAMFNDTLKCFLHL